MIMSWIFYYHFGSPCAPRNVRKKKKKQIDTAGGPTCDFSFIISKDNFSEVFQVIKAKGRKVDLIFRCKKKNVPKIFSPEMVAFHGDEFTMGSNP